MNIDLEDIDISYDYMQYVDKIQMHFNLYNSICNDTTSSTDIYYRTVESKFLNFNIKEEIQRALNAAINSMYY